MSDVYNDFCGQLCEEMDEFEIPNMKIHLFVRRMERFIAKFDGNMFESEEEHLKGFKQYLDEEYGQMVIKKGVHGWHLENCKWFNDDATGERLECNCILIECDCSLMRYYIDAVLKIMAKYEK